MTYLLPPETIKPNTVHQMDALTLLNAFSSGSVDTIISDIPYGVEYKTWDNAPQQVWLSECLRVARGSVVWFGASVTYAVQSIMALTPICDRMLMWSPRFTLKKATLNGMYYRYHPIYVWRMPERQDELVTDVIDVPTDGFHWWNHPATKPIKLMEKLVRAFCPTGGVVIDPFMGSGSTLVAAQNTGRNYVGCDTSAEYVSIARQRLTMPFTVPMFTDKEIARIREGAGR